MSGPLRWRRKSRCSAHCHRPATRRGQRRMAATDFDECVLTLRVTSGPHLASLRLADFFRPTPVAGGGAEDDRPLDWSALMRNRRQLADQCLDAVRHRAVLQTDRSACRLCVFKGRSAMPVGRVSVRIGWAVRPAERRSHRRSERLMMAGDWANAWSPLCNGWGRHAPSDPALASCPCTAYPPTRPPATRAA
ncbi:hypothetical protein P3T23_002447 [Paraburkholderia sp. GAS448]